MNATEQDFPVILLYTVDLPVTKILSLWMKSKSVTIQMKAIGKLLSRVAACRADLTFECFSNVYSLLELLGRKG